MIRENLTQIPDLLLYSMCNVLNACKNIYNKILSSNNKYNNINNNKKANDNNNHKEYINNNLLHIRSLLRHRKKAYGMICFIQETFSTEIFLTKKILHI